MAGIFTITRLRVAVVVIFCAILAITAGSYLTSKRNRAAAIPRAEPISPEVNQQTESFSLSKSLGDQTLYTVEAKRVSYLKESGKAKLEGVSILLFGRDGKRRDRLWSEECEFDPSAGKLWISGKVEMELGIPEQESSDKNSDDALDDPQQKQTSQVSVITSGLLFEQSTGMVSTDNLVQFRLPQGEGESHGAVYDPQTQQLALQSEVRFALREGPENSQGGVVHLQAGKLVIQTGADKIALFAPVNVSLGTHRLVAGDSQIYFDHQKQARAVELTGGVTVNSSENGQDYEMKAQDGKIDFDAEGKIRTLLAENAVNWHSSTGSSALQGEAGRAILRFSKLDGSIQRLETSGSAEITLRNSAGKKSIEQVTATAPRFGSGGQILSANEIDIDLGSGGKSIHQILTRTSSRLELLPASPSEQQWIAQAANFQIDFGPDGQLSQMLGSGGVQLEARERNDPSAVQQSTSDQFRAEYSAATGGVDRLIQWGNFQYQDKEKRARADRAEFYAVGNRAELIGAAKVWNATGNIEAKSISWLGGVGKLTAVGDVISTYSPTASAKSSEQQAVHVVASELEYHAATGKASYTGRPRLWQGDNLLEADRLDIDQKQEQILAAGNVYSLITQETGMQQDMKGPVVIRSNTFLYRAEDRNAHYWGKVKMKSPTVDLTGNDMQIFLARGWTGKIEGNSSRESIINRIVVTGEVQIDQEGRKATGTEAEILPQERTVRIAGDPALVHDPQSGSTQGSKLTYQYGNDSIAVDGRAGLPAETRRQVPR